MTDLQRAQHELENATLALASMATLRRADGDEKAACAQYMDAEGRWSTAVREFRRLAREARKADKP